MQWRDKMFRLNSNSKKNSRSKTGGKLLVLQNCAGQLAKKIVMLSTLACLVVMLSAGTCFASSSVDYTTEKFDVDVVVEQDNSYEFSESITVDFEGPHHGIYVYIPELGIEGITTDSFSMPDQHAPVISDEWVDDWEYSIYEEDGNDVFQIGDADSTVIGRNTYNLGYKMRMVDDGDTSKDFMYIDLLPTGWETAIESTNITVKLPKAVDESAINVYAGFYGDDGVSERVFWDYDADTYTISIEGTDLTKGTGITIFCELPEGYWVDQLNYNWILVAIPIICLVVGALFIGLWMACGRDKKIIPTVEFYPPEGLTPADVGVIVDGKADKKDLISLITYFASKGYLSITQNDKKDFTLKKLIGRMMRHSKRNRALRKFSLTGSLSTEMR